MSIIKNNKFNFVIEMINIVDSTTVGLLSNENIIKEAVHKEKFNAQLSEYIAQDKIRKAISQIDYEKSIASILKFDVEKKSKTAHEYYLKKTYNVLTIGTSSRLVKKTEPNQPLIYIAYNEEIFNLLLAAHKIVGHGGHSKTKVEIEKKYDNITRTMIKLFCSLCLSINLLFILDGAPDS